MKERSNLNWFTSTYSGGSGTECVEAAWIPTGMLIRDSKRSTSPQLELSSTAWAHFIAHVGQHVADERSL
ncbi:DUF397 domain-containing protein [Streptomyces sp. SID8111]|uniref:DUF397 domain-containing protein n=1 Tax=Streptomyces sp. SID8111 TaxID=2706100 RepID=UPI0013C254FD|nr:DUF397 domain-containing protein [Streptomyces sp. SID8111]NEC29717.1 DUF397 domain-containing protein [Streptomyces sp. SID8111]